MNNFDDAIICYVNSKGYKVCTNKPYDFDFAINEIDIDENLDKSLGDNDRYINGFASTEDEDLDGEIILSKGLDIDPFIKYGFFNYDHQPGVDNLVGIPTKKTKITNNGLYVEGILFKGKEFPRAEQVWKLAKFLKKAELPVKRNLGFSIQGKYIRRDPSDNKRILKALVRHVAITHKPVNRATFKSFQLFEKSLREILKGETDIIDDNVIDDDFEPKEIEEMIEFFDNVRLLDDKNYKEFKNMLKSGRGCEKSLSAGYDVGIGVTNGAALRNEQLDDKMIDYFDEHYENSLKLLKSRGFSDSEAKEILGRLYLK